MKASQHLPVCSIGNDRQPGKLPKQARRRAVNQGDQQEQEHGAIQAHQHIQSNSIPRIEGPFQQVGENQQDIENNSLHSVEPHVPTEIRVPHHHEIEREEHQESVEGEALEHSNRRNQRLDEGLERGELRDYVFAVLDAVEEGVEVNDGGD